MNKTGKMKSLILLIFFAMAGFLSVWAKNEVIISTRNNSLVLIAEEGIIIWIFWEESFFRTHSAVVCSRFDRERSSVSGFRTELHLGECDVGATSQW